ncbi:MAG: DNA-directed RNA polymerase [Thermoplasmata archaeon]|nr:MAG: DNA-directed RNA polymerase [Thermoplasmata archaeon]
MNEERKFRNKNQKRMYKAICTRCGKECQVPFKPTKSKPKYCPECYKNLYHWARNSY